MYAVGSGADAYRIPHRRARAGLRPLRRAAVSPTTFSLLPPGRRRPRTGERAARCSQQAGLRCPVDDGPFSRHLPGRTDRRAIGCRGLMTTSETLAEAGLRDRLLGMTT